MYRYCARPDQRVIWQAWKRWPHTFPYPEITWCTDDELRWCEYQQLIDEGLHCCRACGGFGWHEFCGDCGVRFIGADYVRRECPECRARVITDYCGQCGAHVAIPFLKRLERGEVDWIAEAAKAREALVRLAKRADAGAVARQDDGTGRLREVAEILRRVTGDGG